MGTRAPYATPGKTGRPPFARATMLRFDCLQQWFGLSDPAVEEGLQDVVLDLEFTQLNAVMPQLGPHLTAPAPTAATTPQARGCAVGRARRQTARSHLTAPPGGGR